MLFELCYCHWWHFVDNGFYHVPIEEGVVKFSFIPVTFFSSFHFHCLLVASWGKWPQKQSCVLAVCDTRQTGVAVILKLMYKGCCSQGLGTMNVMSNRAHTEKQMWDVLQNWDHSWSLWEGGLAACEYMWSLKSAENLASEATEMGDLRMTSFGPHRVRRSGVFSFSLNLEHLGEPKESSFPLWSWGNLSLLIYKA